MGALIQPYKTVVTVKFAVLDYKKSNELFLQKIFHSNENTDCEHDVFPVNRITHLNSAELSPASEFLVSEAKIAALNTLQWVQICNVIYLELWPKLSASSL